MTEVERLKQEVREVLENNILRFWIDRMQDYEHGGFYGRIDSNNVLHADADKGAILNARILWTFSAAYRVFAHLSPLTTPYLSEYLDMATRAKDYLLKHFRDKAYGGVYWSVDCLGQPKDTKKQFYAIGFALYGLSEYVRATGSQEALIEAVSLYQCIERHALDHEHNGYIEAMTRDWKPIGDMRLSEHDANYPKSQNTHLHIMEPYTNLYRVWPAKELAWSLRNVISIFINHILNRETSHLDLFFENDWTRGAGQMESYGHDIECSWLMHEAALVLGDKDLLNKVESVVKMVAKASEKGLNADGSMTHEADAVTGCADDDLQWWVQAEAVVGFMNIYQYFGDRQALEKALHCWQYIKDNLIDYKNGEWYWSRHRDGSLNCIDDKAGFWKCPYHNGRMCLEILEREL
jgi:mannobiose 2-epimerase